MAVAVSRDLTVQVLEDVNAAKLTDRQQALRNAIQRGEPKCLGVSPELSHIKIKIKNGFIYVLFIPQIHMLQQNRKTNQTKCMKLNRK